MLNLSKVDELLDLVDELYLSLASVCDRQWLGFARALLSRRFCSIQPMECFSLSSCGWALARVACWRVGWTDENLFQATDFSPMLRL